MELNFPLLYFAYGSNLSLKQMAQRCPTSKPIGRATLHGYRLVFSLDCESWGGGVAGVETLEATDALRGGAVIDPALADTTSVEGAIYELQEADLRELDIYEGIAEGEYTRSDVTVERPDGSSLTVMTYFAVRERDHDFPPSERYLDTIIEGAREHGLSEKWIDTLARVTAIDATC